MICSDLDGTILTYDQTELSNRLMEQIRELNRRGILFVPASGRQIVSIEKLFEPVKDCCNYLCSNGSVICDSKSEIIAKIPMPREDAMELAYDFLERTDGRGEVNISGPKCCYLLSRGLGMVERVKFIGSSYKVIEKPEQVDDDIVKVSVYLPDGADKYINRFSEKWKAYNADVAGPYWIDTTLANKGIGVKKLCELKGIAPEEVMAFGDNYNDVSMLDTVGRPYIVSGAVQELLDRYAQHADSVEDVLDEFIRSL